MRWIALQACIRTEPGPVVMDEAAAQRALASIALGFTPRVALEGEAVLLEVSGSLQRTTDFIMVFTPLILMPDGQNP